ncbi:uncharacterized protein LOC111086537 [Limulus polyphemus]|uniref:Uncharacterized protein LOC111086537 n=1 Tax=Limulus polyphemus TaxID=6850 RepID=A0ABM1SP84_LIMPO|nr:uncharacterized protein LOC111086537 [Limulus polyphemus]XP_022245441.1 uncharacterized protein LOC111086537 [Limulus polyphemus]
MAITRKKPLSNSSRQESAVMTTREKNFRCKDCQKSFLHRTNLLCHRKFHAMKRLENGHYVNFSSQYRKESSCSSTMLPSPVPMTVGWTSCSSTILPSFVSMTTGSPCCSSTILPSFVSMTTESPSCSSEILPLSVSMTTGWPSYLNSNACAVETTHSSLPYDDDIQEVSLTPNLTENGVLSFCSNTIDKSVENDKCFRNVNIQDSHYKPTATDVAETHALPSFTVNSGSIECSGTREFPDKSKHQRTLHLPKTPDSCVFSLENIKSFEESEIKITFEEQNRNNLAYSHMLDLYATAPEDTESFKVTGAFQTPKSHDVTRPNMCESNSNSFSRTSADIEGLDGEESAIQKSLQELEQTGHKTVFHRTLRSNWSKLVTDKISAFAFSKALKGHQCSSSFLHCQS